MSLPIPPSQHWFQVGTDSSRCVTCMVVYGQGVWLALQGSALVRLYHAQSWESLTEVDVAPAVHKMLAGKHTCTRFILDSISLFLNSSLSGPINVIQFNHSMFPTLILTSLIPLFPLSPLQPSYHSFISFSPLRCRCNHQTAQGRLSENHSIVGL